MKQKGFTLIELLAVIIILAIIALIAVPLVLHTIDTARRGAAEVSASNYIDAVEKYMVVSQFDDTKVKLQPGVEYQITPEKFDTGSTDETEEEIYIDDLIEVKGDEVPLSGYIVITEDNEVELAQMVISSYIVTHENDVSKVTGTANLIEVKSLSITNKDDNVLPIGNTQQLNVDVDPENVSLRWKSSDKTVATVSQTGVVTAHKQGTATITVIGGAKRDSMEISVPYESIIKNVQSESFANDTITNLYVNDKVYSAHVYSYDGNQVWGSDMTFGNENDVATSTEDYAKNMVVVKVNGDLTINEGVNVTTYSTTYGGPKGFLLYVTGTVTNNGIISMTAKGAYAEGEDVYLWRNTDGTYEYIPATGALGGELVSRTSKGTSPGDAGDDAANRATGGGGGGAARKYSNNGYGGPGGSGTSYSGGAGGGGGAGTSKKARTGGTGSSIGGAGGVGSWMGGGAGNPGGGGSGVGSNGTGGLLILYSYDFINNGTISSDGSAGGTATDEKLTGGGGSGAGSINLFANSFTNNGTFTVTGGAGGTASKGSPGGAGGAGSVTVGSISTGNFTKIELEQ